MIIFVKHYNKRKKTSYRFSKRCVFKNKYDYDDRLIRRDYRTIPINENSKLYIAEYEYIFFENNEKISIIR